MTRLNVSKAREEFPEIVNRAAYANERTIVSRVGPGKNYRVISHIRDEIFLVLVVKVGHRQDVCLVE
jgi:mRNA-degrading endonuclease RelE of RelBE toxin-antitoxin system